MTTPPASPIPANATRFLLLSELCRKLGENGCSSSLLNPAAGAPVLRVDLPATPSEKLAVCAVERTDGWVYTWNGHWAKACHLDQIAHHLTRTVRP